MGFHEAVHDLATELSLVEDRAGRYPRGLARQRQLAFLRTAWPRLLGALAVGLGMTGLTILLPIWVRGFVAGAWVATVLWFLLVIVLQASGAAPIQMGGTAEQWTGQELRRLRKHGWRVASHIAPSFGDVDHIAVGPGGLVVLETKWSADPELLKDTQRIEADCAQVQRGAQQMRRALRARLKDAPVRMAVVYWGTAVTGGTSWERDNISVVQGPDLRSWLEAVSKSPVVMDDGAIESSWETLQEFARLTDRRELGTPTGRKTALRRFADLCLGVLAGLITFWGAAALIRWIGTAASIGLLIPVGGASAFSYRRSSHDSAWRLVSLGVVTGSAVFLVVVGAIYAYASLL